jgi:hypothetical protein
LGLHIFPSNWPLFAGKPHQIHHLLSIDMAPSAVAIPDHEPATSIKPAKMPASSTYVVEGNHEDMECQLSSLSRGPNPLSGTQDHPHLPILHQDWL